MAIGEMEFPRIQFPTLDCRGCVALYQSFIVMDEDEDDEDTSGCCGFRLSASTKMQTVSREQRTQNLIIGMLRKCYMVQYQRYLVL